MALNNPYALSFDGVDDYVKSSSPVNLTNQLTIHTIFQCHKTPAADAWPLILDTGVNETTNVGYALFGNNGWCSRYIPVRHN